MTQWEKQNRGHRSCMTVIVLEALSVFGFAWAMLAMPPNAHRADWPESIRSNGKRICFTGTSASGRRVVLRGCNQYMTMMAGGCVACHGSDRQGGRLMPNFLQVAAPNCRGAVR